MRKNLLALLILTCSVLTANNSFAQQIASGTYAIPGTVTLTSAATISVTSIGTAIDALNTYGVQSGGTVQFNFADAYTETATGTNGSGLGQFTIGTAGSALFSTSYTAVIFKHNGTGTNPKLMASTAGANSTSDYIVRILGADNITFDGIDFVENPANTMTASTTAVTTVAPMEYGVQILNSGINGAQNNTIKNCTITLYNFLSSSSTQSSVNTYGIYQLNTDATARNSGNVYDHVNITRAYRGIVINGMAGAEDVGCVISNCKIGGSNAGDIGGASTTYGGAVDAMGVRIISQQDFTFYNDTVQNVQFARTGSSGIAYGVFLSSTTGTTTFNNNKIFNVINKRTGSASGSPSVGLEIEASSGITNVYNNFIGSIQSSTSGTTTFMLFGIRIQGAGTSNIYHNSIQLPNISGSGLCSSAALCTSDGSTGSSAFTGTANVVDNILANNSNITTGSGKAYCFYFGAGTLATSDYNNFDITPGGSHYYTGFYLGSAKQNLGPGAGTWRTDVGKDANSQQFTTAFASINDLHLTISAPNALYNGIFITTPSITTDIDNETRVYPIIGADEPLFTTTQVRISNNNPGDSIVSKGTVKQVLAGVVLTALGTSNTLSSITFTTGGTYSTSSFTNIKLVYSTTNTIVGATTISTSVTPGSGGTLSFTGLSQPLPLGANYLFVIFDVATGATAGDNIRVTSTPFSSIVLAGGTTKVGTDPVPLGGLQIVAQFYFNYPNSDITLTSSWYETVSGAFNPPPDFISPNQVFNFIANTGSTMGLATGLTSWVVDGTNSKIIVGDGLNSVTFEAKLPVFTNNLVTMDIVDKGVVKFQSNYIPTKLGTLNQGTAATPGSTVEYGDTTITSTADTVIVANYCNLTFSGLTAGTRKFIPNSTIGVSRVFTPGGFTAALNGRLSFNGTLVAQVIPTGYLFNNLRINNTVATTTMAGNVSVDSVLSLNLVTASLTVASGQTLTLTSNATVANLVGSLNINGSLTNNDPLTTVFAGSSPALLLFGANSNYNLSANLNNATNSGQIPSATWAASSTINITNVTMSTVNDLVVGAPSGVGFGNIYFDAPALGTAGYRLFGGFKSTGTGASGSPWIVTLQGNLTLGRNNNNAVDFSSTTSTEYRYINIGGNLLHYAGTYILSDHSGSSSTYGIKMSVTGNATIDATYSTFAPAGGYSNPTYIIANVAGGKGTFEVGGNLATISGANTFTGASQTATISRISTTGTCNLNFTGTSVAQTASFNTPFFGGTGGIAMNVTGAAGVTLISDLTTLGTVNLTGGNFRIQAAKTLTLTGATASSVSSGFTFNVDGTLRNSSTIAGVPVTTAGTLSVNNGGIYEHAINSGSVPTAIWQTGTPGATCFIRGITTNSSGPGGLGQAFYNFLWKCTGQTTNVDLTGNLGPHIYGYFTIDSTGVPASGKGLRLNASSPALYGLTVDGNATVNIGNLTLSYGTSTDTLSCKSLYVTNGSTIILSQTTGNGILRVGDSLTAASGTTITELGTGTVNEIQFIKSGIQILTNVGSTFANDINYTVNGSSTTQLATSSYITVNTGAKLSLLTGGILDINGNTVTVNGLINTGASYLGTFKGSTSSNISLGGTAGANMGTLYFTSGSQLLNNLTFNRTGTSPTATLGTDLQINGACALTSGVFQINGNTLTLNGTYTSGASNAGSLTGSATSNLVVGASATSMPLTFTYDPSKVNNSLKSLIVNKNASLNNGTTSSSLYIVGGTSASPGNITVNGPFVFATNDSLTIQSNASGTAYVGQNLFTTGYISGNVTIERYIQSHRAWRLLTGPISTNQTINASWQEGNTTTVPTSPVYTLSGFGTAITNKIATNPGTTGFDQAVTNNPSILYLNGTVWTAPTATNGTTSTTGNVCGNCATGQEGYMLFVRGDRSVVVKTAPFASPTSTILRTRGKLMMGSKNYNPGVVSGSAFRVIGNPYASEMSMDHIFNTYSTAVGSTYYLWDPLIATGQGVGAFYTITKTVSSYASTTHSLSTDIPGRVESGAAFVLNFSSSTPIQIQETDKTSSGPLVFRPAGQVVDQNFRADLYTVNPDNTTDLNDGTLTLYDTQYSDSVSWLEDAKKIPNISENMSLARNGKLIAIEKRQPITINDTIFLSIANMKQHTYQFVFAANNLIQSGLSAVLEDTYAGTSMPVSLSDTAKINFDVNGDAASQGASRFRIVFRNVNSGPLPVTFTSIKAAQQNSNTIAVQWSITNQLNIKEYIVEKSVDGKTFTQSAVIKATGANGSSINYNCVDPKAVAGDNYYRIVSVSNNGTLSYSQVVNVKIGGTIAFINVYPNPVKDGVIGIQLTNMPKGVYGIRLHSTIGQELLSTQLIHEGGSSLDQVIVNKALAKGVYQLEIIKPDNGKTSLNIVVE